jgi:hypothetical protein
MAKNSDRSLEVDDIVNKLIDEGVNDFRSLRQALGRGGHFSLAAAIKRLALKPSQEGSKKGIHVLFADDTTFTR